MAQIKTELQYKAVCEHVQKQSLKCAASAR